MEFVSPDYEQQLKELAEKLVTPERFATPDTVSELGQLALFVVENQ